MTTIDTNPYALWMRDQARVSRQRAEVAEGLDFVLLLDPQAVSDFWLQPAEPRLNPIEFHGKRRSPARRSRLRRSARRERARQQATSKSLSGAAQRKT